MAVTDAQIQEKTDAINLLLNGIGRPATKAEYLALLDTLRAEREVLINTKNNEEAAAREAEIKARLDYEQTNEYKILVLEGEYNLQFQNLASAYMAALILGDTDTMTANRKAYQVLLAEYNSKLEEIE